MKNEYMVLYTATAPDAGFYRYWELFVLVRFMIGVVLLMLLGIEYMLDLPAAVYGVSV